MEIPNLLSILKGEPPANSDKIMQLNMPNKTFQYSGGGFIIAQKVVMDVLQTDFESIMRKYIFDPVQMVKSTYDVPFYPFAEGHTFNNKLIEGGYHIMPEKAAAGLWSTPTELALYGLHLQKILRGEKGFIKKETLEMMLAPQTEKIVEVGNESCDVGIGCFIKGKGENIRFGHSGWNEGYVSLIEFYKLKGQGMCIIMNSNEGEPLLYELQNAITKTYGWEI